MGLVVEKYLCDTVQVVGFVMPVRGVATKLFITSHWCAVQHVHYAAQMPKGHRMLMKLD